MMAEAIAEMQFGESGMGISRCLVSGLHRCKDFAPGTVSVIAAIHSHLVPPFSGSRKHSATAVERCCHARRRRM